MGEPWHLEGVWMGWGCMIDIREHWAQRSVVLPARVAPTRYEAGGKGRLCESRTRASTSRPFLSAHRTAFLSDPADGSLYTLGTQKQQGLMVCVLPGLEVGGPGFC